MTSLPMPSPGKRAIRWRVDESWIEADMQAIDSSERGAS
jgi:hypothetical protein